MSRVLPLLLLMAALPASAQAPAPGAQVPQTFHYDGPGALAVHYLLYLPEGYDGVAEWPLLLFLHGAGERGDDLDRVAIHGPPRRIREGHALPFIVASPQLPAGHYWQPGTLHALLDDLVARYPVDPARVYVTGLSLGGYGAWALATDRPGRFAAVAPVCGGGDVTRACRLRDLPLWTFHGAQDTVIPLARSEEMVGAVRACGGDPRLTVYPEAGHDSWTEAYADPALYDWLLSHARRE